MISKHVIRMLVAGAFTWLGLSPVVAVAQSRPGADPTQAGQGVESSARRAAAAHAQPGDRVFVHVVGEPLLSDTVTVNERGQIAVPKLGVIDITPFTITELQDTLRARYAVYLRAPAIEVLVLRRVSVNGEVAHPNLYLVNVSTTLRDIIAMAGGITENGDRRKVYVVRDGNQTRIPEWESDQSLASDLHSGDQVVVGRRAWWKSNIFPLTSTLILVTSLVISLRR